MPKRPVIAVDARFLLRPMRGMPLYVTRLCEGLPALRPDLDFVFFINRGFEHNDAPENYRSRLERISGFPNVRMVNQDHDAEIHWEQVLLPRLARQYGADLLHMPGNRIVFNTRIPQVATIHDVMEVLYLKELVPIPPGTGLKLAAYFWRQRLYLRAIYRLGLRRTRRIITVSRYSAADIVRHLGHPGDRITAIHHGVDAAFGAGAPAPREARGYCLMLGGESFQKNAEGAVSAWAALPDDLRRKYPLRVAGSVAGPGSILMGAARRLGVADSVTVEGWVTQERLIELFRGAAAFLFLSRYEGFGFPIIQAMAGGTPVVHSTASCLGEIAGDAGCGFAPDDTAGAAAALARLLTDAEFWRGKQAAGLERAKGFGWEQSLEAHGRVFDQVLGSVR